MAKELDQAGDDPAEADDRAETFAADVAGQGSEAVADSRLRALLRYAERLALSPASCDQGHVQELREVGYDDRAIHDAAQTVAYFAYINRIAEGLGVEPEPEMQG